MTLKKIYPHVIGLFLAAPSLAADITITAAQGGKNRGGIITSEAFPEYRFDEKTLTHTAAQLLTVVLPQAGAETPPTLANAINQTLTEEERLHAILRQCSDLVVDVHFDPQFSPQNGHGLAVYTLNPAQVIEELREPAKRAEDIGNALLKAWRKAGNVSNGETVHYTDTLVLRNPHCPTLLINLDTNITKKSTWFISPQSIMYRMQSLAEAIVSATE